MSRSTRLEITAEDITEVRRKLNNNFREKFFKGFGVGWLPDVDPLGGVVQTVNHKTWTEVQWGNVDDFNESGVEWEGDTIMSFPTLDTDEEGVDASGIWQILSYAGWDNAKAGLETHLRILRGQVSLASAPSSWTNVAQSSTIFRSDAFQAGMVGSGSANRTERWQVQKLEKYLKIEPNLLDVERYRVVAWHNATVASSPVSLDLIRDSLVAPLHMYANLMNVEAGP